MPFSEAQEKAVVLMMEDRRKASEDLFGNLMDFRAGPTQGQEADRLRSALEWMRNEFIAGVQNYLTPEQLIVWNRYRSSAQQAFSTDTQADQAAPKQQTQYVRINNNIFPAEELGYR